VVLNAELLGQKVLYLLRLPWLAFLEELQELFLFVFVEFRGPTAPETRHQFFETALIPRIRPPAAGRCRPRFPVGSFRNRIALIAILHEPKTLNSVLVFGIAEKLMELLL